MILYLSTGMVRPVLHQLMSIFKESRPVVGGLYLIFFSVGELRLQYIGIDPKLLARNGSQCSAESMYHRHAAQSAFAQYLAQAIAVHVLGFGISYAGEYEW